MVNKALAASPGDVEEAWEQSSSLPFVTSPAREVLANSRLGSAPFVCAGGIQLEKDIGASEWCDLGQARSLRNHEYLNPACEPHYSTDPW